MQEAQLTGAALLLSPDKEWHARTAQALQRAGVRPRAQALRGFPQRLAHFGQIRHQGGHHVGHVSTIPRLQRKHLRAHVCTHSSPWRSACAVHAGWHGHCKSGLHACMCWEYVHADTAAGRPLRTADIMRRSRPGLLGPYRAARSSSLGTSSSQPSYSSAARSCSGGVPSSPAATLRHKQRKAQAARLGNALSVCDA